MKGVTVFRNERGEVVEYPSGLKVAFDADEVARLRVILDAPSRKGQKRRSPRTRMHLFGDKELLDG